MRYVRSFYIANFSAVKTEGLPQLPDPLHPHNHCKRTTHPCSALNSPPLSKVRCCRPKEFGRLPEGLLSYRTLSVSQTPPLTIPQSQCRKTRFSANASSTFIKSNIENVVHHCASSLYTRELKVILLYQPFQNHTIPRSALNLPPLSKVRCCRPKKFGRLPEGLLYTHQPLHPHNHFKRTTHPCSALNSPSLSKVRYCRPKKFGRLQKGLLYTHQPLHLHNHFKKTIIPHSTSVLLYNTSITQKSVHRLIRQPLEQLHRKTGTQRRNNSTLPCSHYRKIKKQQ